MRVGKTDRHKTGNSRPVYHRVLQVAYNTAREHRPLHPQPPTSLKQLSNPNPNTQPHSSLLTLGPPTFLPCAVYAS